jgi:hypothetical protein
MANQLLTRPPVAELVFQGFDRPFHPEFIQSYASEKFEREGYQLRLHLIRGGHMVEWRRGPVCLVELLGDSKQVVPEPGPLFAHRLGGERGEHFRPASHVTYSTRFGVEKIPREIFYQVDGELRDQSKESGILKLLSANDRLGRSPLSFVELESRTGSVIIKTWHTFPCEYAVVKSSTLIEFE